MHFRVMQEVKALGHGWMCEVGDTGVDEQRENSSTAHIALLCCFTGPELPAADYSFSVLTTTRFL